MISLFLAFYATPADAQETFNAHGFVAAPTDGDVLDPLIALRAERQIPMSFGISGLFEFAKSPLVMYAGDKSFFDVMRDKLHWGARNDRGAKGGA